MSDRQTEGKKAEWREIGAIQEFADNQVHGVSVDDIKLIIVKLGSSVFCFADRCSHQDVPLSAFAEVDPCQRELICHAHGARFSLDLDGEAAFQSPIKPLTSFPCRVKGKMLQVNIGFSSRSFLG